MNRPAVYDYVNGELKKIIVHPETLEVRDLKWYEKLLYSGGFI